MRNWKEMIIWPLNMSEFYVNRIKRQAKPRSKRLHGLAVSGSADSSYQSHVVEKGFVTLSTAQTVTGDKTFASDVIPGGQKADGTRGRLFLPSSLGTGAVDIFVDTETGIDGETPVSGAGGNAAWEVSTHRAHAVLNVSGERKEVALYGHRHTVSEISGLLGTDGLILSSLLPSVQSPVTSVAGLTGDITVSALRDALTDTDHLFVTSAEKSLWTSKWTWSEEAVKAVKVNNAVNADRLGGVPASDYVRTAALEDFCEGYLKWGALPQDNGSIQVTNGLGQSRSVSLHGHHHAVSDVDTGDGWDALLGSAAPSTLSGWGITDAYTKDQVSQILGNYLPLAGGRMLNKAGIRWATGGMTDLDLARDSGLMIGYAATDTSSDSFPDGVGYLSVLSVLPSIYGFQIASTVTDNELYFRRQGDYSGTSWSAWKKILDSSNVGSYALTPSNYTSTLDSRYALTAADNNLISHSNEFNFIPSGFSNNIAVNYRAKGGNGSISQYTFYNGAGQLATISAGNVLINGSTVWHSGNDGSGSGLDADLLDGTHKSGLLTALTSNATTNLSLTVGGTVKTVTDLYATYLEGQTLAGTRRGMSFLTSKFTAAGWYRVFTSTYTNVVYATEVILHIGRTYTSPQNEHYSFSICVGYNGDISITQLSGVMGGHLITKIRVVWDNSEIFHIDIYSTASSYSNTYGVTGQGYGTFYAFTPNAAIPSEYTAYEFTTVDGCKSDRGFTGTLSGNASSATKLATARTLWGQSFDGTGNVSGGLTGATFVKNDAYYIGDAANGVSKEGALVLAYYSKPIYFYTSSAQRMIIDGSGNVGIGTTAPAYKLHVVGSGYFSSTLKTASELNANTVRISATSATAHLAFGRANYNYITAPSGGGIAFVTNGREVSGDNTDMYIGDGRVSVGGSLSSEKLHVPSSLGNEVFDIYVDTEVNIDGEVPVSGGGLDVDSLWTELSGSADGRVISGQHIPLATSSSNGGIRTGYSGTGKNYPVRLNSTGQAYVSVPWENTTYTLAGLGGVPTSRKVNGLALSSDITLDGADIRLTGYSEGSSTAVVAATDTVNTAIAKLQNQIQTKQASGSYMTIDTNQMITGMKTIIGNPWCVRMSKDTSNAVNGLVWKDTSGTSIAGLNYYNTAKRIFINANYPDITDIWSDAAGKYSLRIGWNELTYNSYPILRSDNIGSYALTKSNYTSTLDGRYMRIGSSGYPTAYRKVFNVNGTAWSFLGTTTDAPTIYAPATAGTSGYVLQSTAGTPKWAAQNTLVVKGIYEKSLGVTAGDTMADLKASLLSLMEGSLNKPGSMGYVTSNSVTSLMSNWSNDSYALVAGSRTNFLRLDGYGSSKYGVFLVSGYGGSFYRLMGTDSKWAGPYTILDTGNYTSHLDSRYVNVSGDTMTGNLTVPRLVVQGTVTGNSTRYIYSDAADNIYMSVGGVVPLVARPECVRRGASAASVTLGTSTYPWADTYTKKLHITDTSSVAHLSFGRTDAFNYISLPGASSTLAIAPGGNISGKGSALCISNSATYPGYSSGTRSLGTSSYRWSNIYSVAGNFSGLLRASDGVQIGDASDYGWYIGTGTRISAGISAARGVNVGSLLVSNLWADYSKVPENGIYSKGEIVCSSDIYPDVTASVKLGSGTKRWLGVYAQNGSFSGNVSVSSLNVVTEATVKTLVPDKLHLPSSLGNEVFDIYVDTEVNIDGETPVSVSFQPQWYGWINADGTAAKQGGSATLTAVRTAAGTLRLNGIAADSTVIAVPATFITGSTASPRTTASVLKSGSVHYVQTYNNAGTRANLAFYLLVI